jgi:hypothetical protein
MKEHANMIDLFGSWIEAVNKHCGIFLSALFMRRENTTMFTTNETDFLQLTNNIFTHVNDEEFTVFVKCRSKKDCKTFFLEFTPAESSDEWWNYSTEAPQSYINLLTEVGIINKKNKSN